MFTPDKKLMKDSMGKAYTQSLFLEIGYVTDTAMYTLKDEDHTHKGVTYPSLKQLYLAHEDLTEYDFANTYLIGWSHWKRLKRNKQLAPYFNDWAEELELKIRSQAVRDIIDMTTHDSSFQAARWLSDRGWEKRGAGRPSKQDIERENAMQDRMEDEFKGDIVRMKRVK
jgi:hypothetical protein